MTSRITNRLGDSPVEAVKAPCKVMPTTNIVLQGLQTISSVSLTEGDRVLVAGQSDATENGIYVVKPGAWKRAPDWDRDTDVVNGVMVMTQNDGLMHRAVLTEPFQLNITEVTFSQNEAWSIDYVDADGQHHWIDDFLDNVPTSIKVDTDVTGSDSLTDTNERTVHITLKDSAVDRIFERGAIQVVDNVAALRQLTPDPTRKIRTAGVNTPGDGGGGDWYAVTGAAAGTYTDNTGTVIVPTEGDGSTAWVREDATGKHSSKWFGALGDGVTDESVELQKAVDNSQHLLIPAGVEIFAKNITIGSNKKIEINGIVKLPSNSAAGSVIFKNKDTNGNKNITIYGTGTLDGNKSNQSGTTDEEWHALVKMENCEYFEFAVRKIKGNYFPKTVNSAYTTGAVYVKSSDFTKIHDTEGNDYGRECYWIENSDHCEIYNVVTKGGTDSWSGVQISGNHNKAYNLYIEDAGASGISFDSKNSEINTVTVKGNAYFNGVNFGHSGIPADNTTAINIKSYNSAGKGINVAAGTTGLQINSFYVESAVEHGINISDGAKEITVSNGRSVNNGGDGIRIFANSGVNANKYRLTNITTTGNSGYGLGIDGCTVELNNGDLSGNSGGKLLKLNSAIELFTAVRLDQTDTLSEGVSIAGNPPGTGVQVTNANVLTNTKIKIEAANDQAAAAMPYLKTVIDGGFTIDTVNTPAAGAYIRWNIL